MSNHTAIEISSGYTASGLSYAKLQVKCFEATLDASQHCIAAHAYSAFSNAAACRPDLSSSVILVVPPPACQLVFQLNCLLTAVIHCFGCNLDCFSTALAC